MTRVVTLACAALSLAACAFHVQVGVSGRYTDSGTFVDGVFVPKYVWTNMTDEVGATNGYYEGFSLSPANLSHVQGMEFAISTRGNNYNGRKNFTCAETVDLGTFGYYNASIPGQDWRMNYSLFTCRGNPYSVVVNDTGIDRTINGVLVKEGHGARLPFPLELYMDEINGVKFYDLETWDELTPHADQYTGDIYLNSDHYYLGWTGDIRIVDPASNRVISAERLLYGEDASNSIVYAENDYPIYEGRVLVSTNVQLNTWWDFTQSEWGDPKAYINGVEVCPNHSTSHIIAYTVNAQDIYVSEMSGEGTFYFTMSQTPESGHGGGSCVFKCWDANAGSTTAGYAAATSEHKAAISGGASTLAEFKVTINIYTGKWKVEPAY